MKNPSFNLFLGFALASSATVSSTFAASINKAATGTELTDAASWGGVAPTSADIATWNSSSLTGAQTVGGAVTWSQISLANTTALSISGSPITLAGGATATSLDVISGTPTGSTTITNDLLLTGVVSGTAVPVAYTTGRLQLNSAGSGANLILGNVTSNGGAITNDANLFLRGTGGGNTINGTLTVDGQLGKGDTGTWTLNGSNSVGWVFINNGTLLAGNDGAFGAGTIYIRPTGSSSLTLASATSDARNFTNALDFATFTNTAIFGQAAGGTGALTFAGGVNLDTASRKIATNVATTFSGVVSGAGGGIAKSGTGTLTLSGINTYTGITSIDVGTLAVGNNAALGGSQLKMNGGTIAAADMTARTIFTGRFIDFATNGTFGTATTGDLTLADTMSLGTSVDKTATINNATTTFSGVIYDNSKGARIFTKAGPGNLILSGNNTYERSTVVNGGTLTVANLNALGPRMSTAATPAVLPVTVNGGTLDLGSYNVDKAAIGLNGGKLTGTAYTGAVNIGGNAAITGNFPGTVSTGTDASRAINTTGGLAVANLTGQGTFTGGMVNVSTQHDLGSTPGSQTFNDGLTYGDNSALKIDISPDGLTFDLAAVTDGLSIGANVALSLSLSGPANYGTAFWDSSHSFPFLNADTISGDFSTVSLAGLGDTTGQGIWSVDKDLDGAGGYTAVWTAVPEPSAVLLGGLGLLGLLRRRR